MSCFTNLLRFLLLHWLVASFQINLDLTDVRNEGDKENSALQHDCLHVAAPVDKESDPREIVSYCMGEWPSTWNTQVRGRDRTFSFAELQQERITSEQLYLWSAPMDVAEQYQSYLNEWSMHKQTFLALRLFYNCTPPNFGPLCQYSFDDGNPYETSLNEIVHSIYQVSYNPSTLTCYTHLQCDRGSASACLDWSEICDGQVHCLDGGRDEEHCWQLEVMECEENEYQCANGQCIPFTLFRDHPAVPDCLDRTDELHFLKDSRDRCSKSEPTFGCEDVTCTHRYALNANLLTGSCVQKRHDLLMQAIFLNKPNDVRNDCWLAIMCMMSIPESWLNQPCTVTCANRTCQDVIQEQCPDLLYVPAVPILFGHVYLLFEKNDSTQFVRNKWRPKYVCYKDSLCSQFGDQVTVLSYDNNTCRLFKDVYLRPIIDVGKLLHYCISETLEKVREALINIKDRIRTFNCELTFSSMLVIFLC